jgi:hypothetical protein
MKQRMMKSLTLLAMTVGLGSGLQAQYAAGTNFKKMSVYAGIEVGSKGVKMSVLEINKGADSRGAFTILKDTTINTDFISFNVPSFNATVNGLGTFYMICHRDFGVATERIFTTVSSGVKMQAEKEHKSKWVDSLIQVFKSNINEPQRKVDVIDVLTESKLSHLGIVPEKERFNTFLIDIGSGNTKGGFFPNGNTNSFRMFQLNWGTKSMTNAAVKRGGDDKSLETFDKNVKRIAKEAENADITFAVNASGSFPASDNVAFSGGIVWAAANLIRPEQVNNSVVTVTYDEVVKLNEWLFTNFKSLSDSALSRSIKNKTVDKKLVTKNIKAVYKVFDQQALMAGTALLVKIMRQFESTTEKKQFYFVKNGQVGWVSAYVNANKKD